MCLLSAPQACSPLRSPVWAFILCTFRSLGAQPRVLLLGLWFSLLVVFCSACISWLSFHRRCHFSPNSLVAEISGSRFFIFWFLWGFVLFLNWSLESSSWGNYGTAQVNSYYVSRHHCGEDKPSVLVWHPIELVAPTSELLQNSLVMQSSWRLCLSSPFETDLRPIFP